MSSSLPVLILDGGLGTTLEEPPHLVQFGLETPLWSAHPLISDSSTLINAHKSFLAAGANILSTATYQTSIDGFARTPRVTSDLRAGIPETYGYTSEEASNYMRSAVLLATEAFTQTQRPPRIALSLGPYGATMTPAQDYMAHYPETMCAQSALKQWHEERLLVFASQHGIWNRCDWVAFETLKRLDEVKAIREVMAATGNSKGNKKWWLSGVFPDDVDDLQVVRDWTRAALADGSDSNDSSGILATPWGIGVNCTTIDKTDRVIRAMEAEVFTILKEQRDQSSANGGWQPWLVMYPDGAIGLKYDVETMRWNRTTVNSEPRRWANRMFKLVHDIKSRRAPWAGIVVGGCCKTTPNDIRNLNALLGNEEVL